MSDLSQINNVSDLLQYNKNVEDPEDRVESTLKVVYQLTAVEAKAVVLDMIDTFIEYHNNVAERLVEEGETDKSLGWARDAGNLQVAWNAIKNVDI